MFDHVALRADDYEGAIQESSAAITLFPDSVEAYRYRAAAYQILGMTASAIAHQHEVESLAGASERDLSVRRLIAVGRVTGHL